MKATGLIRRGGVILVGLITVMFLAFASERSSAAAPDIVLYASDISHAVGLSLIDDTSAAGGRKLSIPDNGWSSTSEPPPPSEAFVASFAFDAPVTGDYRLWLRLRGQNDTKWNESVWVQFFRATRDGAPIYRWGTNDALLVNLEDCYACGIDSWGWQDNSWWLNQSSLVTLPAGVQYMYVIVREDGVEIDQIVLSPERYLNEAPGPVKNDHTILAKGPEDRVTIEGGTFIFDDDFGDLDVSGSEGFSLQASVSVHSGAGAGSLMTDCSAGCPPREEVSLRHHWSGLDVQSVQVTLRGRTYESNGANDLSSVTIDLGGFARMPPPAADQDTAQITAPFHFGQAFRYNGGTGEPSGRAVLVGGGRVTASLRYSGIDQTWYFEGAEFEFLDPNGGTATPPGTGEIVLYAADAVAVHELSLENDATAAGGQRLSSTDAGWSSIEEPPAPNTAPYATFSITVDEPGAYRVWLRLRAQDDSKWNDSVWVQFSDASQSSTPVYQWGTDEGLLVNLEDCWSCGVAAWGWQDNSWWLNQSSLVDLPAGTQQLYVTLREDGVSFDQIVLSRDQYVDVPPGPVKNDQTIVPKP